MLDAGGGGHTSQALNQPPSLEPYRLFSEEEEREGRGGEEEREGRVRGSGWACGKKLLPFLCVSVIFDYTHNLQVCDTKLEIQLPPSSITFWRILPLFVPMKGLKLDKSHN